MYTGEGGVRFFLEFLPKPFGVSNVILNVCSNQNKKQKNCNLGSKSWKLCMVSTEFSS